MGRKSPTKNGKGAQKGSQKWQPASSGKAELAKEAPVEDFMKAPVDEEARDVAFMKATLDAEMDAAVQTYTCRLLCRILAAPAPAPRRQAQARCRPFFAGSGPIVGGGGTSSDAGGATWNFVDEDVVVEKSDCDSMLCSESPASPQSSFPGRLAASLRGSLVRLGDRWDAVDVAAETLTKKVEVKAMESGAMAEEKAILGSKQLEGLINIKVAFLEDKTRSALDVVDASANKYSQQLEGKAVAAKAVVTEKSVAMADKTKAAAIFMRSKSGEIASNARTKSGEFASSTKGKLQAAGQSGLLAVAKSFGRAPATAGA